MSETWFRRSIKKRRPYSDQRFKTPSSLFLEIDVKHYCLIGRNRFKSAEMRCVWRFSGRHGYSKMRSYQKTSSYQFSSSNHEMRKIMEIRGAQDRYLFKSYFRISEHAWKKPISHPGISKRTGGSRTFYRDGLISGNTWAVNTPCHGKS